MEKVFDMMGIFFSCLDYAANDYSKMEILNHNMKKIRDATQVFTKSPFQEQTKNLTIFNMIHWVAGLIVLLPKRLMVQVKAF